ncbi:hypothetical protein BBJ28_00004594 [Nothophytophthora sp. Chile5]|nr:hypothetical protein BBJ28_00004594 [Nothophytophthora sp. Chile5]
MSELATPSGYKEPTRAIFVQRDLRHFLGSQEKNPVLASCAGHSDVVTGGERSLLLGCWMLLACHVSNSSLSESPFLLEQRTPAMQEAMLPEDVRGAVIELAAYLDDSFGNRVRIDYGTGHETSFIVWMCCLYKIGFFTQQDFPALVLRLFVTYLALMRRLQKLYMLEPAGSHGVWGLDDYHCLPFYFGSAQLIGQEEILPESVHDDAVLQAHHKEYLYLDAIKFIKEVKAGSPFAETSPMLNDISALPTWEKTNGGMLKLYEGEVLKKLPVIQHLRFGSLFPCTWTPSHDAEDGSTYIPVSTHPGTGVRAPNFDLEGVSAKAPWVAVEDLAAAKDTQMSPLRHTKKHLDQ